MQTKEIIKERFTKQMLVSAGIFIAGKKHIEQLVQSLEESGLTKQEAQDSAQDILFSAHAYKQTFMKKLMMRLEQKIPKKTNRHAG